MLSLKDKIVFVTGQRRDRGRGRLRRGGKSGVRRRVRIEG
jgi:hypothetical protein